MARPKKIHLFKLKPYTNSTGSSSWRITGTKRDGTRVRQNFADKGYRPCGESRQPDRTSTTHGQDSGIRCQLLNPVEETDLDRLLGSDAIRLQEKFDGRRLMVRKRGDEITGINRRGLLIPILEPIRHAFEELPVDVLIDGEAVGDTLHAFDLLEVKGHDIRGNGYLSRFAGLLTLLDPEHKHLRPVNTYMEAEEKRAMFETFRRTGSEGVVFKEIDAAFSAGRPNSSGSQMKYKFVESASFVVTGHNVKRSVNLGLLASEGDGIVPAGNVTILPNQRIPAIGQVCEIRYLYAFRESGSIFQPVYLGERKDIPTEDCTTAQLKYKAEPLAA